jgi:hypothetical protein
MRVAIVLIALAALGIGPSVVADRAVAGSFTSSDPLLNEIWTASVRTATDMVAAGPLTVDAENRPCGIMLPQVLLDGLVRDRCPYSGDQAVSGMTLLDSTPDDIPVLRAMVLWYAEHQDPSGAIPSTPLSGGVNVLFDYNAYWVEDLYDYVLYTGDRGLVHRVWPNLVKLMDTWYPAQMGAEGLLVDNLGTGDYAGIARTGTTVAYFNAGYARALGFAAQIAGWVGEGLSARAWDARLGPLSAAFTTAFWDPAAGAFRDATVGRVVHPQDGNVFAILGGLASETQADSALTYLAAHDAQPYGATIADDDVWDNSVWGHKADMHAFPFITYFEVLARYQAGQDASALDAIRREWGYMLHNGPKTTMWEEIGPFGGGPPNFYPSYDHGWSSGAAPALTDYTLGVTPATPGFASFRAQPHLGDLEWANGTVPTPLGPIRFGWQLAEGTMTATVDSPVPGIIVLPVKGLVRLDGRVIPPQGGDVTVHVPSGTHGILVILTS